MECSFFFIVRGPKTWGKNDFKQLILAANVNQDERIILSGKLLTKNNQFVLY